MNKVPLERCRINNIFMLFSKIWSLKYFPIGYWSMNGFNFLFFFHLHRKKSHWRGEVRNEFRLEKMHVSFVCIYSYISSDVSDKVSVQTCALFVVFCMLSVWGAINWYTAEAPQETELDFSFEGRKEGINQFLHS